MSSTSRSVDSFIFDKTTVKCDSYIGMLNRKHSAYSTGGHGTTANAVAGEKE